MLSYKGRELDEATLIRIAATGRIITVDLHLLDVVGTIECNDLVVTPNGERYDILAGTFKMVTDRKTKEVVQAVHQPVRLMSKLMIKQVENFPDLVANTPYVPDRPAYNNYDDRPRRPYDRDRQDNNQMGNAFSRAREERR